MSKTEQQVMYGYNITFSIHQWRNYPEVTAMAYEHAPTAIERHAAEKGHRLTGPVTIHRTIGCYYQRWTDRHGEEQFMVEECDIDDPRCEQVRVFWEAPAVAL